MFFSLGESNFCVFPQKRIFQDSALMSLEVKRSFCLVAAGMYVLVLIQTRFLITSAFF